MLSQAKQIIVGIYTRLSTDALVDACFTNLLDLFYISFLRFRSAQSYAKQLTECTQRIEEALKEYGAKFDRLLESQQSKEQNTRKKPEFYDVNRCLVL